MPKRSTTFQELIELLERSLAPLGSIVTPSKLLKDKRTGEEREVDIVIESKLGTHPFTIGVEVIEHKRKATTPWIEAIAKKHEDLAIDKTIAVSKSGFYQPALKKAEAYNIEALTLDETKDIDWQSKLVNLSHITIGSFLIPQLTHANLIFQDNESLEHFSNDDIGQLNLYNKSGDLVGVLHDYLDSFMFDPIFIAAVEEKAYLDDVTVIDGHLHLPKDSYVLDVNNRIHKVKSVHFRAKCKKQEMKADLVKGHYGEVYVALASGSTFGKPVRVAIAEVDGSDPKLSFRIADDG